jgi:hypothetical protein
MPSFLTASSNGTVVQRLLLTHYFRSKSIGKAHAQPFAMWANRDDEATD